MKTFKKIICLALIIGIVSALTFGLVACNDGKTITVGYTDFNPMNYLDENGTLIGFDTELARKVFKDLGYKVVFKEIEWNNKYMDLESGNISCIWNGFTSNGVDDGKSRSEIVDFSYNYMKNFQAVVVKKSDLANYTSIKKSFVNVFGKVEAGSAGEEYAKNFEQANVSTVTNQMSALQDLAGNGCKFVVVDYLLANSIVGKGNFSDLAIVESLNSDTEYYAIGFKKGSDLTAKVNAQLEKYAKDGSLLALAAKYKLTNALVTDFSSQK